MNTARREKKNLTAEWAINTKGKVMSNTSYTVGSSGMIMKSGCDTHYSVSSSGIIHKYGGSTGLSVDNSGKIKKDGSETGYVVSGGTTIMKESDKGYDIDWLFR
jgi:hypothetical protein